MRLTVRQRASWLAHLYKASTQQHHRELERLFRPYVPIDAVVVDIGAHAGQFSKLFAGMARRGRIYAFEPSAYARSILRPALLVSGAANVTVVPVGLSDAPGQSVLRTPLKASTAWGFGTAHLGGLDTSREVSQPVALDTLDRFAARRKLKRLDFIKADIEGWELRALMGGEASLRQFHPAIYLEVDPEMMARAGHKPQDLFRWLGALGYRAFATPSMAPAPRWTGRGDYLFVADERD